MAEPAIHDTSCATTSESIGPVCTTVPPVATSSVAVASVLPLRISRPFTLPPMETDDAVVLPERVAWATFAPVAPIDSAGAVPRKVPDPTMLSVPMFAAPVRSTLPCVNNVELWPPPSDAPGASTMLPTWTLEPSRSGWRSVPAGMYALVTESGTTCGYQLATSDQLLEAVPVQRAP